MKFYSCSFSGYDQKCSSFFALYKMIVGNEIVRSLTYISDRSFDVNPTDGFWVSLECFAFNTSNDESFIRNCLCDIPNIYFEIFYKTSSLNSVRCYGNIEIIENMVLLGYFD